MLAVLADPPLSGADLVYEPKYDGIRALITVTPNGTKHADVAIASRVGNDKTAQFPELVHGLSRWGARRAGVALLDGEIVALDADGQPAGFQRIQDRIHLTDPREIVARAADAPVAFVAFDLLHDAGEDLFALPLVERRRRLEAALRGAPGDAVRLSTQVRGDGEKLLAEARARGWEGLVVKVASSPYRPGRRSHEWRKLKLLKSDSFVVGGFTEPRGARSRFGALLVGVPGPGGRLRFAGHVGGGFSDAALDRIARRLAPLETTRCPFDTRPVTNERPHWTRPVLVAEVKYLAISDDGMLRAPIFVGLRDDIPSGPSKGPEPPAMSSARRSRAALDAIPGGDVHGTESGSRAPRGAAPTTPAVPRALADKSPSRAARARVREQIDALAERGGGRLLLPDGGSLALTNLAKRLWPALGVSKADLFRHYLDVAPFILPVIRDRPLVMRRFPDGVEGHAFFQHRAPDDVPPGVRREAIPGDDVPTRLVGGGLPTLLYMVQLAVISQDPWFARAQSPRAIDFAAIDLDPMDGASPSRVRDVARWVRDEVELLGVTGHLKTSGARGLHIYLPMRPGTPFEAGQLFCRLIASVVAGRHPDAATVERAVKRRDPTAVFLDCLQNGFGKTLACAYSARASAFAGVSTPLAWKELDRAFDPRAFTMRTLPGRLRDVGDLWAPLRKAKGIDLDAVLDRARSKHPT